MQTIFTSGGESIWRMSTDGSPSRKYAPLPTRKKLFPFCVRSGVCGLMHFLRTKNARRLVPATCSGGHLSYPSRGFRHQLRKSCSNSHSWAIPLRQLVGSPRRTHGEASFSGDDVFPLRILSVFYPQQLGEVCVHSLMRVL